MEFEEAMMARAAVQGDESARIWLSELDNRRSTDMTEQLYDPGKRTPLFVPREGSSDEFNWNEYAVVLAEKLDLPITFRYVKSEWHDPAPRRLESIEVKANANGDLVIVGNDPDRGKVRSFRVDRITDFVKIDR